MLFPYGIDWDSFSFSFFVCGSVSPCTKVLWLTGRLCRTVMPRLILNACFNPTLPSAGSAIPDTVPRIFFTHLGPCKHPRCTSLCMSLHFRAYSRFKIETYSFVHVLCKRVYSQKRLDLLKSKRKKQGESQAKHQGGCKDDRAHSPWVHTYAWYDSSLFSEQLGNGERFFSAMSVISCHGSFWSLS